MIAENLVMPMTRPKTPEEAQAAIMALIQRQPGLDYLGIAKELRLRLKQTVRIVKRLVAEGLILAVPATQDSAQGG